MRVRKRGRSAALTLEQQDEVVRYYVEELWPTQKIATLFGVGKATVQRVLVAHKVPLRGLSAAGKIGQQGRGVSQKVKTDIIRLFKEGNSLAAIGQWAGLSASRVGQIIRAEGHSTRR
jgi:hypothetical protein